MPKKKRKKQKALNKDALEKMRANAVRQSKKELIIISCIAVVILSFIIYIVLK